MGPSPRRLITALFIGRRGAQASAGAGQRRMLMTLHVIRSSESDGAPFPRAAVRTPRDPLHHGYAPRRGGSCHPFLPRRSLLCLSRPPPPLSTDVAASSSFADVIYFYYYSPQPSLRVHSAAERQLFLFQIRLMHQNASLELNAFIPRSARLARAIVEC